MVARPKFPMPSPAPQGARSKTEYASFLLLFLDLLRNLMLSNSQFKSKLEATKFDQFMADQYQRWGRRADPTVGDILFVLAKGFRIFIVAFVKPIQPGALAFHPY